MSLLKSQKPLNPLKGTLIKSVKKTKEVGVKKISLFDHQGEEFGNF